MLAMTTFDAVKDKGADVGNLRVSSVAVEFDLLSTSREVMERCLMRLEETFGPALTIRELDSYNQALNPAQALREGVVLFNEERYWESHESLEAVWRISAGVEREILQGIILLAASLVHLQKDESAVALSIMRRANPKLPQEGTLGNIDLTELKRRLGKILAENQPTFLKLPIKKSFLI
jgi:hypothetical protein